MYIDANEWGKETRKKSITNVKEDDVDDEEKKTKNDIQHHTQHRCRRQWCDIVLLFVPPAAEESKAGAPVERQSAREREREGEEKATTTTNHSTQVCMCRTHTDKKSNKQSTSIHTHTRAPFSQYTNTFDELNKLLIEWRRCY